MLQNVGKFGIVVALSAFGLAWLGWKAYAIVGGVVLLTTIIVLIQGLDGVERRSKLILDKAYSLKLEAIYIVVFGIAFGALWPALPLIAVFGTDGTDEQPDPSDPRAR